MGSVLLTKFLKRNVYDFTILFFQYSLPVN